MFSSSGSNKFLSNVAKNIRKVQDWNEFRIDTLALIVYNYFLIFLIANKDMEWSFHPFKNDFIADRIGLQFENPVILPKFGLLFRSLTIFFNMFGLLPFLIPKSKYKDCLMPVLMWNVYTVTALLENLLQILVSIISLQVPVKVIFSVLASGCFVILLYLKLILQAINFYEQLHGMA